MATPLLGWISPKDRTPAQQAAHAAAVAKHRAFALAPPIASGPVKIMLTDLWKDAECVADMGQEFIGFHQLTGSCVGVSAGDAVTTLTCVQRKIAAAPTKAYIVFWGFPYGRTRLAEGDSGQGEGAIDSVMGQTLISEGCFDITQSGLPQFKSDDGLYLTSGTEMTWSDGGRIAQNWRDIAKKFPLGAAATLSSPADIKAAILNGYPVLDGCDNYIGNGSIVGSGDTAYVKGHYDGQGGHSTCYLGYWDHPNDGPLYLYSNQWPTSTYPKDPAGAGRCCVWTPESEVAKLFRTGGSGGETMALSHQTAFPAQPEVLNWSTI